MEAASVLLVEDYAPDIELAQSALARWKTPHEVVVAETGDEALEYLRREDVPSPAIILLDLAMPGLDGLSLLTALKSDTVLRRIPVVVVSGGDSEAMVDAVRARADYFVSKTADRGRFQAAIAGLEPLVHEARSQHTGLRVVR